MPLMKEFREFAMKGNVIDLAVGVVIGAAFGKIVSALVADIIMPLVGAILPGNEWRTYQVTRLHLKVGDLLGAVLDFLIIATVLFFVVVKLLGAFKKKEATTKQCTECLETVPRAARRCRACASPLV
jgi:large conductance mechanosensitive channel